MTTINLKVLVDKKKNKIAMAETESDFVDILYSFMAMPMGAIVRLISQQSEPAIIGSMSSLYKAVEDLEEHFLCTQTCKPMLLHPTNPENKYCKKLKVNIDDTEAPKYYICADWECIRGKRSGLYTAFKNVRCHCGKMMDNEIHMVEEEDVAATLSGMTKYVVTDDLELEPMTPAATMALLHKLGVKDKSSLQPTALSISSEEVLCLLNGLLFSKTPLTYAFIKREGFTDDSEARVMKKQTIDFKSEDIELKLIISKSRMEVLYAEVGEDVVDFIVSFLAYPLGNILDILDGNSSLGSMDNLYKSVQRSNVMEDSLRLQLLHPRVCRGYGCTSNPLGVDEARQPLSSIWCRSYSVIGSYGDSTYVGYLTAEKSEPCKPKEHFSQLHFVNPKSPTSRPEGGGGFLKGPETFMVKDNLDFTPLADTSSITFVKSMKVDLDDLEIRTVKVGREQALRLLKASLFSKSVLTDALVNFGVKSPEQEERKRRKIQLGT